MCRLALVTGIWRGGVGVRGLCQSCDPGPSLSAAGLEGSGSCPRSSAGALPAPVTLTEPYSLPLLLMATKNRLATPKMLTTPRSTGESSSRPGGGARVIPGQGTLGPCLPLQPPPRPARLRDPISGVGVNGPSSLAQATPKETPEHSVRGRGLALLWSRPRGGRAQSRTIGSKLARRPPSPAGTWA